MMSDPKKLLIGAHTSAQGGAFHAILEGQEIGATTVQLFTRNQKRWESPPLSEEEKQLFKQAVAESGMRNIMSHDSYLINLGSPDPEGLQKSRNAFRKEIERCQQLEITFLNFHPGAALESSIESCLDRIVESLLQLEDMIDRGSTRLLLETTAGQGSSVGHCFEHLAYILERTHLKIPLGVCIDTCHIFSAGYDIRTKEAWEQTLSSFDRIIGLSHLFAFHVNDSMKPFGARKDRHAPLGKGEIGMECFRIMMTDPRLRDIPKYLETPDGPPLWREEIALLRHLAGTT